MTPNVSIIMPVYNAEKYLHRAVDSILNQTMQEWELIMIDDGSRDSSPRICDEYAARDARIRVIHKANAGVSAARQDGIDAVQGEYTIHADSDDWVEPTMLEELYAKAKSEKADMVICDYYTNTLDKQTLNIQKPTDVMDNTQTIRDLFQQLHGSCWNKLVARACYSDYGIRFPEGLNYCEDQLTIVRLLSNPVKCTYLNKAYYHYFDNPGSITRHYQRSQYETRLRFADLLTESLPTELIDVILPKVRFGIFTEAVIYDVLTKEEVTCGLSKYKGQISQLGIRWRIGFKILSLGFKQSSKLFLRY